MKTYIASSENFNVLQMCRNYISDRFYRKDINKITWCGNWNGMNWSNFKFNATDDAINTLNERMKEEGFEITFSES